MKVKLEIDTKTFVRFWLVVIGFALALNLIYNVRGALFIVGAAIFLALALNTPVTKLAKRLPGKSRVGGTAISYVAVVAFLVSFIFLVVPPIIQQTAKVAETLPSLVDSATKQYDGIQTFIDRYDMQPQVDSFVNSIKDSSASFATNFGTNLISGIGSVITTVGTVIMVLGLSFFMLIEGPTWMKLIWSTYSDKKQMKYHRTVIRKMYDVVNGYILGQLSVSSIAGGFTGLTVFILSMFSNVPANFSIPALAIIFVFSLIPMFGETIGALIISLVLAINDPTAALIFFLVFVAYMQVENNYVVPKIQSKRLDLSALSVLVAVIVGIFLFGIAGGIISIPIAGCIKVLLDEYSIKRQKQDVDPVDSETKTIHA